MYLFYSSVVIGFNVWFIVTAGLSPKLLVTGIIIMSILLIKDLKSKLIIEGDKIYYEKLIGKKSFSIHDIFRVFRGEKSGMNGRFHYIYVQDIYMNDIFELPESLPQKKELDYFKEVIKTVNPKVYVELKKVEIKLF